MTRDPAAATRPPAPREEQDAAPDRSAASPQGAGGEPRPPVRALLTTTVRSVASVAALLALYSLMPLDRPFGWPTVAVLVGGLVGVGVLVALQVRSILRSPFPGLRAVETLSLTLPLFLLLFAAADVALSASDAAAFTEHLDHLDGVYFVVTVFATVGFGDIAPVSETARLITTVQMVGDLLVLGLVVRAVLSAVQRGRARSDEGPHTR